MHMFRYDRSYDYGLRGAPRQARSSAPDGRPRRPNAGFEGPRQGGYEGHYRGTPGDDRYERRADPRARAGNRVTAPYTYDYVYGGRGARRPRNFNAYTGDRPDRIRDGDAYRRPYSTEGGTHTGRGSIRPYGYDVPDFGPDFGGRYPDEL
jgi:hypothetical protein